MVAAGAAQYLKQLPPVGRAISVGVEWRNDAHVPLLGLSGARTSAPNRRPSEVRHPACVPLYDGAVWLLIESCYVKSTAPLARDLNARVTPPPGQSVATLARLLRSHFLARVATTMVAIALH